MFHRVKVSEFEKGLLLRDGRFVRVLDAGVHWVRGEVIAADLRRRDTEVDAAPVWTRDLVPVGVRIRISYQVTDPAATILRSFEYRAHLANDAAASVHRSVSRVAMGDLAEEHNRLEDEIRDRLSLETASYGVRVEDVAIIQVRFPRAIRRKLKRMEATGLA